MPNENKSHWEQVYATKQPHEVSWTQEVPQTSLDFIRGFQLPLTAGIIDIGGGDSKLVDCLLAEGYEDITVLDISEAALDKAKRRLGAAGDKVKWIVSDITGFVPERTYDVWHDRAAFHFLTTPAQIDAYISVAQRAAKNYMVISTFSSNGPLKCSGLVIQQYTEAGLEARLAPTFTKIACTTQDHTTPFNTTQNFLFCSFKRS